MLDIQFSQSSLMYDTWRVSNLVDSCRLTRVTRTIGITPIMPQRTTASGAERSRSTTFHAGKPYQLQLALLGD